MKSLNNLLDDINVILPWQWENAASTVIGNWYAVANTNGIIAYFDNEVDAYRFRLDYINRILNP